MSLRVLTVAFLSAALLALPAKADEPALDPLQPCPARRSEPVTYQVEFTVVVTAPAKTKTLKVWLPIPPSNGTQEITGSNLATFPAEVAPRLATEKVFGNRFAYFEFDRPQGAQIIRHRFTAKTWELHWDVDPARVQKVERWPAAFDSCLRSERFVIVDERTRKLAGEIVPRSTGEAQDLGAVMTWVNEHLRYDHSDCSLKASALYALDHKAGHCSDYHGLCAALGRTLGYPTRVAYGLNLVANSSPSHCKLEAFLPPYGWVCFDVSSTQQLIKRIQDDPRLDGARKEQLMKAARERLLHGFRDNTWLAQTHGTDYDLVPPASRRVPVVRTIYAEADGEPLPDPDPADPTQHRFAWMTAHRFVPDRPVTNPFADWHSLLQKKPQP